MEKQFAYVLSVDTKGSVVGYEAQEVINALPELKHGDVLVSESIYRRVHEGCSKSERFRYIGGDLISDGIDLNTHKREVLATVRKKALSKLQRIEVVCGMTVKKYAVRVDDALLSHLQLAKVCNDVAVLSSIEDAAVWAFTRDIDHILDVILQRRNCAHRIIGNVRLRLDAARSEFEVNRIAADAESEVERIE